MNYWVIGILILLFGVVGDYIYHKYRKTRDPILLYVVLLLALLEVEARKARDRWRQRKDS